MKPRVSRAVATTKMLTGLQGFDEIHMSCLVQDGERSRALTIVRSRGTGPAQGKRS